jgi:hypothetical protein
MRLQCHALAAGVFSNPREQTRRASVAAIMPAGLHELRKQYLRNTVTDQRFVRVALDHALDRL